MTTLDTATVVDATYRALMLVLILSLPVVITSAVVGLLTAMAQAVHSQKPAPKRRRDSANATNRNTA